MAPEDRVIAGITSTFKTSQSNHRTEFHYSNKSRFNHKRRTLQVLRGTHNRSTPESLLHWKRFLKLQVVYSTNSKKETEHYNLSEFVKCFSPKVLQQEVKETKSAAS